MNKVVQSFHQCVSEKQYYDKYVPVPATVENFGKFKFQKLLFSTTYFENKILKPGHVIATIEKRMST